MAMTILNNSAAMMTLGELNKNITNIGKSLEKVSTGQRITGASGDTASFAISEVMRVKIRSLEQDSQNVQNGSAMLKIASAGIEEIVNELRELRQLAIDAANDSNTDADRATMQKVFNQKRDNIDDIAITTNYNTKSLLDGTYKKIESISPSPPLEPPTNDEGTINGSMTITKNGIYTLDPGCNNANITIKAPNVKIVGSSSTNSNVYIECANESVNLWLENYNINLSSANDISAIRFKGIGNYLHLSESNIINHGGISRVSQKATINVGNGLTIDGDGSLTINRNVPGSFGLSASIGSDAYDTNANKAYIIINGNDDNTAPDIQLNGDQVGAAIGAGGGGCIGDITINGGKIYAIAGGGTPAIGSGGYNYVSGGSVGRITINGGDITLRNSGGGGSTALLGSSGGAKDDGVYVYGGKVDIQNGAGMAIDPKYKSHLANPDGLTSSTYEQDLPNVSSEDTGREGKYNPIWIQYGTEANQHINVYINSMRIAALGIDTADITTRMNANSAIRIVDNAITYALDEATNVGACLKRLEYTESNIQIEGENVQAAESTIRDADMAKEITEYTKLNVLSQSSQAMLAQANQNLSGVLSLLQ